jgi:hypothetical protein
MIHREKEPMKIAITVADITLTAQLNDTQTARAIADGLPLEGLLTTHGKADSEQV